jgi:F0F1-type ATP synthase membrane subunit b/b'
MSKSKSESENNNSNHILSLSSIIGIVIGAITFIIICFFIYRYVYLPTHNTIKNPLESVQSQNFKSLKNKYPNIL